MLRDQAKVPGWYAARVSVHYTTCNICEATCGLAVHVERGRIARIEPAGGAALYDALSQGAAQLRRFASAANTSELILLTDGVSSPGDFEGLAQTMTSSKMTVSTVAVGDAGQ